MVAAQRPTLSAGRHGLLIFQHPVWVIPQQCLFKLQTRAYRPEVRGGRILRVKVGKPLKQFRFDPLLMFTEHFLQASSMS